MPTGIYIRTEATRKAISISHKGQKPWITGRKHTEETKAKIRHFRSKYVFTQATKDKIRTSALARGIRPPILPLSENPRASGKTWKLSAEVKKALSEARKGEKNPGWKGGITTENDKIRKSLEYRLWREAVFKRDNYTCVWCGQKGGRLNADHIKSFAVHPELRLEIDNGRTLCLPCHKKTSTYGRKRKMA